MLDRNLEHFFNLGGGTDQGTRQTLSEDGHGFDPGQVFLGDTVEDELTSGLEEREVE